MRSSGCYVYGLIRTAENKDFGCIGLEHDGRPGRVYTVSVDSVAAVVSEYAGRDKVLPLRRNLEPHHRVIREVMKTATIVPMSFGHVARNEAEVQRTLRRNRDSLRGELDRVDGKVEMGLKVKWDVDNIFEHFVGLDPELAAHRDELFGRSHAPTPAEKIELGQMFERRLAQEREAQTERVTEAFRAHFSEVKVNPPKHELTVMDLAFLVPREGVTAFEKCVYEVAGTFPAQYLFDFSGPWAPFNFVELDLHQAAA
ncbi:MAG: GvpL/GvpF family gas vesicle protein [Deltaproteobacteria bacterium]|nr:GvpL/GvpF family gas vesicle protein [Deltaproteobacteria bacterium]